MKRSVRSILTCFGLSFFASGCALTSKSDSVILRYFALDDARTHAPPPDAARAQTSALQLRLGRVNGATYLKDRIAFRDSNVEVGYYDDLRWTEKPESYVRRALGRALFEERGIKQIVSGFGPTLEVELNAFEELRTPKHAVRVEMTWLLRDEQVVSTQESFVVERPLATTKDVAAPGDIAVALSAALDEAVQRIVTRAIAALTTKTEAPVSTRAVE